MSAPCHDFLSAAGCRYAERCRFAHSTINPHDRALEGKQPPHQKLKTEVCKFFNSPQGCRSGSNCGFQHIASFPAERRAFISEWSCPDNNCITLPLEEDGMYDFIVVSVLEFTRMIVFSATLTHGYREVTLFTHAHMQLLHRCDSFDRVFAWTGVGRRALRPSNSMHAGDPPLLTSRAKAPDVHGDYSRAHRWLAIRRQSQ